MEQLSARVTFGPIPDSGELLRYQQIQSDLPERIMRQYERRMELAERQSDHRMRLEARVIGNNITMERLGWGSATAFGLIVITGSLWLVHEGKSLVGLSGVILGLATLLGLFVFSRRDQVQDIAKKRAAEMLKHDVTPDQLELLPESNEA